MDDSTLFSIKDFAAFTGMRQSTLRYYDEIGLLTPICRGKNNYRYYEPYQIILLNFINVLIDIGVPLAKVKDMMKGRNPQGILELLNQKEADLNYKFNEIRTAFSIIQTYRENIQSGINQEEEDICVRDLPEANVVFGEKNDWSNQKSFYEPFIKFCNRANRLRINLRYPIGGVHNDMISFLEAPGQPHRFYSLDPLGNSKRRAGKYLIGYKRGYYGEFGDFPLKMQAYAKENNLIFKGPVYAHYLLDEISIKENEQYLAQIAVRVG
ncbi:MAG: MerR family transcriptional regulator [Oscillospiraceae bacterium]|nr:MerR family transcriptional regulator [Oscillospiraceae bacterium]